jgi:long-chain acyl-CoA synthetase
MVVGDGHKFPAVLIVPSIDGLHEWCRRKEITYTTDEAMLRKERIVNRIWKDVERTNENFGKWEQIKKMTILQQPFTVEGGELTPTLKLKRKAINAKYAEEIEAFYKD